MKPAECLTEEGLVRLKKYLLWYFGQLALFQCINILPSQIQQCKCDSDAMVMIQFLRVT
jgi:hypothetical protein